MPVSAPSGPKDPTTRWPITLPLLRRKQIGDSHRFARWLTTEVGVAVVAGINFYTRDREKHGEGIVRFAFAKRLETLHEAGQTPGDDWAVDGSLYSTTRKYTLEGS